MPIYHYRCKKCGYDFTKEQSFSDDPIKVCPQCGRCIKCMPLCRSRSKAAGSTGPTAIARRSDAMPFTGRPIVD